MMLDEMFAVAETSLGLRTSDVTDDVKTVYSHCQLNVLHSLIVSTTALPSDYGSATSELERVRPVLYLVGDS